MTGPRSDPPIPMFTMCVTFLPVTPRHSPERTRSANAEIASSTACTSASICCPSTTSTGSAPSGRRSAVCSTARSSLVLMCTPASIAANRSATPVCSASRTRAARTSDVTRFFDRSTCRSARSKVRLSTRPASSANQPRRSGENDSCRAASSVQAVVEVGSIGEVMPPTLAPRRRLRAMISRDDFRRRRDAFPGPADQAAAPGRTICCSVQVLPSGSSKDTNRPHASSSTPCASTPASRSCASAPSASGTTTWIVF